MIKKITECGGTLMGLSDNGELYELKPKTVAHDESGYPIRSNYQWSHVCSSPDDRVKPAL